MNTPGNIELAADLIHRGFDDYHQRFRAVTRRARKRFADRDWSGIRRDTADRLNLHGRYVGECIDQLRTEFGPRLEQEEFWRELKKTFTYEILGRDDFEIAQTYFNSIVRRIFLHTGVIPQIDYVAEDFPLPYSGWEMTSARTYAVREISEPVICKVLRNADLTHPFVDLEADSRAVTHRLQQGLLDHFGDKTIEALDVLRPVFVRNKAAYLIGRARRGNEVMPVVLSVLNEDRGLAVDAVLHTEKDLSILFSFARWYFHADVENPREVIGFLHSILPRKRIFELYISLGYNKHGKTEFYTDLMRTVRETEEEFIVAPGKPGLVMSVFTLPSYEFVFKVIRDDFPEQKSVTPDEVKEKYRHVLRHDRVGRLVDFQEFEFLEIPKSRFSPELLDELLTSAGRTVRLEGANVIVRHLYVGRRVTPLDLYLNTASPSDARAATIDWGYALKDLAAANVFAGDMLLKNFGVTRHGRVVFYDYDEICPLVDCRFRRIPPPRNDWDEMAAEPWFSVGPHDVFPEEFRSFLSLAPELHALFEERHGDLFATALWKELQERNRSGELIDFYPYDGALRLRPEAASAPTAANVGDSPGTA